MCKAKEVCHGGYGECRFCLEEKEKLENLTKYEDEAILKIEEFLRFIIDFQFISEFEGYGDDLKYQTKKRLEEFKNLIYSQIDENLKIPRYLR